MVSELRLVYHVAVRCLSVRCLSVAKQAMIALRVCAMPPSRGLLEANPFWALDSRGCLTILIDLRPFLSPSEL